jgi:hypothetical protein
MGIDHPAHEVPAVEVVPAVRDSLIKDLTADLTAE